MNVSGLVRLGKDGEIRTTQTGKQLLSLLFVFDSGFGDNKVSTWCEGVMFGDRGVKLADYLKKGQQICVHGDNVSVESFQGKSGLMTKLKMNIISIELVSRSSEQQSQPVQKPVQQPVQSTNSYANADTYKFDNDLEDLPF